MIGIQFGQKIGDWDITYEGEPIGTKSAIYEIVFSPSRNRYKLKTSGYRPKELRGYEIAVQKLNEFQSTPKVEDFIKFLQSDHVIVTNENGKIIPNAIITTRNDKRETNL